MGATDGDAMTLVIGGWELCGTTEGVGDALSFSTDEAQEWLPAVVPGGVHPTLVAAGRLPDPFDDDNLPQHRWIEDREWWYRARFDADAGDIRVTADGLDTIAELFVDGRSIGHHANQFRPAEFDVTLDTGGEHVMLIRFSRPLPRVAEAEENGIKGAAQVAADLRKAAFSWGWDFGPRLPSIGLSGVVTVDRTARSRLAAPHARTSFLASDHSRAHVLVSVDVENAEIGTDAAPLSIDVVLTAPDGTASAQTAPLTGGSATIELIVDDPDLWWTHDLGRPALHDLRVELRSAHGIVDTHISRVGIRTIELSRPIDPVDGGRLFQFVLNGMPLFVRGANWVPPSPLVGVVDSTLRRELVQRAAEGGMSMLRVWGGGIYEHDVFYDACDEFGILVWQDFMFACIVYPGDVPAFVDEVEIEARYQIRRLRSRACLALWCGNNETEALERIREHDGHPPREWGHHIFHTVLPRALEALDGVTAYWPGSPWGETVSEVNGFRDGDRHSWEVWHGRNGAPFFTELADRGDRPGYARHWRRYAADTGRFITEFGILSAPNRETFDRWMPGVQLHDDVFDAHLTDRPNDKIEQIMEIATGLPEDLEQYIDSTQTVQAEAVLFAIEHFRRRQPRTAGTLVWQLNDCWPGMTWSLIDVDGTPKAAYYAMARASAPLAVSIAEDGEGGVEVWLVNNTRRRQKIPIDVEIGTFDGEERVSHRVVGEAEAATSVLVWSTTASADERHYVWASSPDDAFPIARKHFVDPGALQVNPSSLSWGVDGPYLDLVSQGYSYGIRISHPEPATRLSDNWFDMRDGDRRRILVRNTDPALLRVGPSRLHGLEYRKEDA